MLLFTDDDVIESSGCHDVAGATTAAEWQPCASLWRKSHDAAANSSRASRYYVMHVACVRHITKLLSGSGGSAAVAGSLVQYFFRPTRSEACVRSNSNLVVNDDTVIL